MTAPVIAETPHGKDVHAAHLSDLVIYSHRLQAAYKLSPSWWSAFRVTVLLTPEMQKHTLAPKEHTILVIKGLCCRSPSSSVRLPTVKADRIKPQVGAPGELNLLICLRLLLKGHYCHLPADSKTGTMSVHFALEDFPSFASPERMIMAAKTHYFQDLGEVQQVEHRAYPILLSTTMNEMNFQAAMFVCTGT